MVDAPLLDFPVHWGDPYLITYEFKTDMVVSRSGREQRRALRSSPRKSIEYKVVLHQTERQRFLRTLSGYHHQMLRIHEATRFIFLTEDVSDGSDHCTVSEAPDWLAVGAAVVLAFDRRTTHLEVSAILGDQVWFTQTIDGTWPAGSKLHPVLNGNLARQIRAPQITNNLATASFSFDVDPASEPVVEPFEDPEMFYDREVFLTKPNWIDDVNWTYEHEIETVDYGRGRIARFLPIQFETGLYEATYLSRTAEDADRLRRFFHRMMGQAGEFYMPTWNEDMTPRSVVFKDSNTIRVVGRETFDVYEIDTVNRALVIFLRNGTYVFGKVMSVQLFSDSLGVDSIIEVQDPWPTDINLTDVLMICWMPVWRFATDSLTLEWISDSVAQTKLSLKTLEALAVDAPPIIRKRHKLSGKAAFSAAWRYVFPENYFAPFAAVGAFDADAEMRTDLAVEMNAHGAFDGTVSYSLDVSFGAEGQVTTALTYQFETMPPFIGSSDFSGEHEDVSFQSTQFSAGGLLVGDHAGFYHTRADFVSVALYEAVPLFYQAVDVSLSGTAGFSAIRDDISFQSTQFAASGLLIGDQVSFYHTRADFVSAALYEVAAPAFFRVTSVSFGGTSTFAGVSARFFTTTASWQGRGTLAATAVDYLYGTPLTLFLTKEDELDYRVNTVMVSHNY